MADRIYIDTEEYIQIASRIALLRQDLGDCASALRRIQPGREGGGDLKVELSGRVRSITAAMPDGTVTTVLNRLSNIIRRVEEHTSKLEGNVKKAAVMFEGTERTLSNRDGTANEAAPYAVARFWGHAEALESGGGGAPMQGNRTIEETMTRIQLTPVADLVNRLSTLKISGETGKSGSIFTGEASKITEKGGISAGYSALSASARAGGQAGMTAYQYGELGESSIIYLPGAKGEAGVSVTVFEADVTTSYEIIDNVEAAASGYVKVGEASAQAEGQLGYADGEFGAYVKLEAEAIGGEIGGEASLDAAGLKGTVSGSLNYGIGAHAQAGYDGGVITVDIGVAVGVGASVSVDLDIGGFVENVTDGLMGFAESIMSSY